MPANVVDPDPKNERAIRAYTRAGFRKSRVTIGEDGDLVQVMVHPKASEFQNALPPRNAWHA